MFSSGSLSLGRLFGIPFQLHWSVLVVAVLFGSGLAANYGTVGAAIALVAALFLRANPSSMARVTA